MNSINSNNSISLVNHASIFIETYGVNILTDPWYFGEAFNKGWSLLHENPPSDIKEILNKVTHIYISHEHPDHFSIPFFKKYCSSLINNEIEIIFQETTDKRVINFLKSLGLKTIEVPNNKWIIINKFINIKIFSVGSIDSTILIETPENYFINTNDCELSILDGIKIKKSLSKNKKVILFHQFSYAAWRANTKWMKKAAKFKLNKIFEISRLFKADLVIPFASFIYFSHEENFHLNANVNKPNVVSDFLETKEINHTFLEIYPKIYNVDELISCKDKLSQVNRSSIEEWNLRYLDLKSKIYKENDDEDIKETDIKKYLARIKQSNNMFLMKLIRLLSFNIIFGATNLYIKDQKKAYVLRYDYVKKINLAREDCVVEINKDSFNLIIQQDYGLDTLSVNGRLKEIQNDGFRKLIYSLGFSTLNASGYGIKFKDFMKFNLLRRIIMIPLRLILKND